MTDDTPIISRAQARAAGLKRYYDGEPCGAGHLAGKLVVNSLCVECKRLYDAARYQANAEAVKTRRADYYRENRKRVCDYMQRRYRGLSEEAKAKHRERWRQRDPEAERQRKLAYKARNRTKIAAARLVYRIKNPMKVKLTEAEYRARNADRINARIAAWSAANPEKCRARVRNRRARLKAVEGFHTAEDVQRIYESQGGLCAHCREAVGRKYHVDHIQAISKGGSNWPDNLQILCPPCNQRKFNNPDPHFTAKELT